MLLRHGCASPPARGGAPETDFRHTLASPAPYHMASTPNTTPPGRFAEHRPVRAPNQALMMGSAGSTREISSGSLVITACLRSPGAQHHVDVDYVVVATACAQQPHTARDIRRHDGDVDIPRLQQPGQPDLAGTAPRLRDRSDRNADRTPTPDGLFQPGLHGDRLGRMIEREKRAGVEGQSGGAFGRHPASLSSRPGVPVRPGAVEFPGAPAAGSRRAPESRRSTRPAPLPGSPARHSPQEPRPRTS